MVLSQIERWYRIYGHERESIVIALRDERGMTYNKIALTFDLSRERIRQIYRTGLKRRSQELRKGAPYLYRISSSIINGM